MSQNLKKQYIQTMLKLKKLMSIGFGNHVAENKIDINMTELILMKEIADNTPDSENNVCFSDVRDYLSITKAAVSHMLGVLENKGYVNRETDKNNRRNVILTLTKKGREVLAIQYAEFNDNLEKLITHLGEEDVRQLIMTLNKIVEFKSELYSELKQN